MVPKSGTNAKGMRVIESAGGLIVNKGRVCLAWQPRRRNWALPKGSIEEGETPAQTAAREVMEEAGVRGEPVKELGLLEREGLKDTGPAWKVIHMFLFRTGEEELRPTEKQHTAKWFTLEEAMRTDPYPEEREFMLRHKTEILGRD